jgi:hypothetical protein
MISVVTGVVVVGLGAAAWLFAPSLQSSKRQVDDRVDVQTEVARRLLDAYDSRLDVSEAAARGDFVDVDGAERIQEIVENDSRTVLTITGEHESRLNDLRKPARAIAQQLQSEFQRLDPTAEVSTPDSFNIGRNASGIVRSMSEGLKDRHDFRRENEKLLKEAVATMSQGLAETVGEASGRDNLHANRMNGIVLFQQGLALQREASFVRQDAEAALRSVTSSATRLKSLQRESNLVQSSGIDAAIGTRSGEVDALREELEAASARVDELKSTIAEL